MKKLICSVILSVSIAISLFGCGSSSSSTTSQVTQGESASVEAEESNKLLHGELVSWNENNFDGRKVLVIKAKIKPNLTNKLTIEQNYDNVADVIKNQNGSEFDEIQYWAVADMTNGTENKVISFTIDKETINAISEGKIVFSQIEEYATDLFIHKSLK